MTIDVEPIPSHKKKRKDRTAEVVTGDLEDAAENERGERKRRKKERKREKEGAIDGALSISLSPWSWLTRTP